MTMHLLAISMGHPSGSVEKESACNGGHQRLKNPLGQENLLEEEMATHSSILAWRITWTEESGGLQSMGSQKVGHN